MFGLFDWIKIGSGVIVGAALISGPVYFYGKSVGKAEVVSELKDDRIDVLKDGKKVDEEVFNSDDAALCAILGGCLSDNSEPDEPLRRVGPDRPEAGNQ